MKKDKMIKEKEQDLKNVDIIEDLIKTLIDSKELIGYIDLLPYEMKVIRPLIQPSYNNCEITDDEYEQFCKDIRVTITKVNGLEFTQRWQINSNTVTTY